MREDRGCPRARQVQAFTTPAEDSSLEWQREGFDFDFDVAAADLPRPSVLLPHLGREVTTVTAVENGWRMQRTGTIPSFDPLAFALGVGLAAMATEIR